MTDLTVPQAAARLGCSPRVVYRMCRDSILKAHKANRWHIDAASVEEVAAWYDNNRKPYRTVEGTTPGRSIVISPSSKSRTRRPGHVGLVVAMQKIRDKRPELAR
jgi:hypothetical protein